MPLENLELREELEIDLANVPRHVAIIMDGNRRWAQKNDKTPLEGHWQGAETLCSITSAALNLGIEYLTVYSFSTENWMRSKKEVEGLMNLFELYLKRQKMTMIQEGIRLEAIGDLDGLPLSVQKTITDVKNATKSGTGLTLILALNYGGRNEVIRGVKRILEDSKNGLIDKDDLDEGLFSNYLDTKGLRDPDLLVRTSGEMRISNFLLWQLSYSELFITDTLWPDFSKKDLLAAILDYQKRDRRAGI